MWSTEKSSRYRSMVYVHSMKSVFGGGQTEGKSANFSFTMSIPDSPSGKTERHSSNGMFVISIGVVLSLPKKCSSNSWHSVFNVVSHSDQVCLEFLHLKPLIESHQYISFDPSECYSLSPGRAPPDKSLIDCKDALGTLTTNRGFITEEGRRTN